MEWRLPYRLEARPHPRPGRPRWITRAALLIAFLLPCGCVPDNLRQWVHNGFKVGPNYSRPPAPVAAEWIQASDPRVQGLPPRDGDWWEVFQDPTLNSLIGLAYQQNPNLRSVGTRVIQARAQQAIAVGNIFPQSQQLLGLYPYGNVARSAPHLQPTHLEITAFNLSWELDFWGKYRRQVESANAQLDASVETYDAALVTLLADMATNYVQYRVAQQRIKIARDNLRMQERLVAVAARQQKVGTANVLDVEQLRTLMEQTRSTIPALEITLGQANDRLCILLGEPPHDLGPDLGPGPDLHSLPMPTTPATVAAGIPADLLRRRPDVRSAERQVAAQSAQIGVAKANLYPSISIGTILGQQDLSLFGLIKSSGGLAFITPQISWNILNYGRLVNNVHLQDARTQELIATYQSTVLTAAQEVQTALRGFLRSQEQAEALARGAVAAVAATQIEEKLFSDLKADVNRLFTLANSRLQAQDQLSISQGNIALNLINVYRALGGGWELRLQSDHLSGPPSATAPSPVPGGGAPAVGPTAVPPAMPAVPVPNDLPEALPKRDSGPAVTPVSGTRGA